MPCCAPSSSCPRWKPCAPTLPATWARSARPCWRASATRRPSRARRARPRPETHGAASSMRPKVPSRSFPACFRSSSWRRSRPRRKPCAARRAPTTACSPSTTSAWTTSRASIAASSRATAARRARARSTRARAPCRTSTSTRVNACSATSRWRPRTRRAAAWASRARSTSTRTTRSGSRSSRSWAGAWCCPIRPRRRPTRRASNPCRPSRCAIRRSFPTAIS